jgi:hypothetical protein
MLPQRLDVHFPPVRGRIGLEEPHHLGDGSVGVFSKHSFSPLEPGGTSPERHRWKSFCFITWLFQSSVRTQPSRVTVAAIEGVQSSAKQADALLPKTLYQAYEATSELQGCHAGPPGHALLSVTAR